MEQKTNVREIALNMLMELAAGKEQSHILIRNVLNKYNYLEEYDKAFLKRVTEGTLERLISIDYVINAYSSVPVNRMKPLIRSLMRMSVYQLLYMDKVPDSAACNEAVKLANKRGFSKLRGFVNGVLRNIARNKDKLQLPDRNKDLTKALSVEYSMPENLTRLILEQYGEILGEKILKGYLMEKPVSVRVRECFPKEKQEEIVAHFADCGMNVTPHPYLPYAYFLKETGDFMQDSYFRDGFYTVQDVSSMLVCEVAGIRASDRILDVCAAPGGKSIHACDKLVAAGVCKTGNKDDALPDGGREGFGLDDTVSAGSVEARDVSEYKTSLILENKERMQVDRLSVKVWDATVRDETAVSKYDVVILDIPCSGMGVIGKKPDIKYRLNEESFEELSLLQRRIADTVWDYVKPGGTLVYSTCTIRKEENEQMVDYLTSAHPLVPVSISEALPESLRNEDTLKGCLTLLPGEYSDGFFIAKMVRKK